MTAVGANAGTDGQLSRLGLSQADAHLVLARSTLRVPSESLAEGGEGIVYPLQHLARKDGRPLVYKEYKPARRSELHPSAFGPLLRFPSSLSASASAWLQDRAAWPAAVVVDQGPVGVVLPRIPDDFSFRRRRHDGRAELIPAKVELLLNGQDFLRRIGLVFGDWERFFLLGSVAEVLAFLHGRGVAVGDFSCRNLMFQVRSKPACYFIDCDSMHIAGHSVLPVGETPEWEVPAGEAVATPATDIYKFSLLALRLFSGAQHHRDPRRLPSSPTLEPLRDAVSKGLSNRPELRPSMAVFVQLLSRALATTPPTPVEVMRQAVPLAPDIWHCRHDMMLNAGPSCVRCHRPRQVASLETNGPIVQTRPPRRQANANRAKSGSWPPPPGPASPSGRRPAAPAVSNRISKRGMRRVSTRQLVNVALLLWAACLLTFVGLWALETFFHGTLHQVGADALHVLPAIFAAYFAVAVFVTLTERKT